jgi:hypothetical protein
MFSFFRERRNKPKVSSHHQWISPTEDAFATGSREVLFHRSFALSLCLSLKTNVHTSIHSIPMQGERRRSWNDLSLTVLLPSM